MAQPFLVQRAKAHPDFQIFTAKKILEQIYDHKTLHSTEIHEKYIVIIFPKITPCVNLFWFHCAHPKYTV